MVKLGIYPGSFDPLTYGHLDIIERSLKFCDKLLIGIGKNSEKESLFSVDNKIKMIESSIGHLDKNRIQIESFNGLLVNFAIQKNANIIIRGIRAFSDFDFEFNLAGVNYKLFPQIETIFLSASENVQFISSKFVKEIAQFNGDISKFVPPAVENYMKMAIKK